MANMILQRRFGGEKLDATEFVRPGTFMVQQLGAHFASNTSKEAYKNLCWRYVRDKITYPPGNPKTLDWHTMKAYGSTQNPLISYTVNDYWNFPSETLAQRIGDCDDKSILLVSLLRRKFDARSVYCTVGTLNGIGHMWVSVWDGTQWEVLDTTEAGHTLYREGNSYKPSYRFNDKHVLQLG